MSSDDTLRLQDLLNRTGGLLSVDGVTGPATRRAVREARALAGLPPGETADPALLRWLERQPPPSPDLPTRGVSFIAQEEVGGRDYYEAHSARPHWPGGASGITIGIGYDLRFSKPTFEADWGQRLPTEMLAALRPHLGKRGSAAEAQALADYRVAWPVAWQVFVGRSLPQQVESTRRAYETFDRLPALCRAALASLVYNRGPGLTDSRGRNTRREMRRIHDLLADDCLDEVPYQFLAMRRLWPDAAGLRRRREAEAEMWREGLAAG